MSRILLKEIISLKNQKEVYLVQDDEGAFLYRKKTIQKYSLALQCRKISCNKRMKLNPIKNVTGRKTKVTNYNLVDTAD